MKKQEIIEFGKQLYEKDLTFATSGNISVKTDDGILITASGTSLGRLEEDDIVLMDFDGSVIGAGKPSCEKMLNVEVYKQRHDVKSIIFIFLSNRPSGIDNNDEQSEKHPVK